MKLSSPPHRARLRKAQALLLTICALLGADNIARAKGPDPLPLPVAQNLPVQIVLAQKSGLETRPMGNMAGEAFSGALPAAIGRLQGDASVKANKPRLDEIRARVGKDEFDRKIEQALRGVLATERIAPVVNFVISDKAWSEDEALEQAKSSNGVVLRVQPFHGFDAYFNALEVSIVVSAGKVTRSPSGKIKEETLFSRNYSFYSVMPDFRGKVENASAWRWKRVGDDALRTMIDQGIAQTTAMLAYDFSAEGQAEFVRDKPWEKFKISHIRKKGSIARQQDGIIWYRAWGENLTADQPIGLESDATAPKN